MEGDGKFIGLARGQKPYVQVNEPFRGIAIMNVSLTKEFQYELVERANKKISRSNDRDRRRFGGICYIEKYLMIN